MALSIIGAADEGIKKIDASPPRDLTQGELSVLMSPFDLKRLESYAKNMLDYHVILDLMPIIATWYFEKRLGEEVKLSAVQSSILLALGLQRKTIEDVEVGSVFINIIVPPRLTICNH